MISLERKRGERETNICIYDINTGSIIEIEPQHYPGVAGQYIIYVEGEVQKHSPTLKAYDFFENREYTLLDILNHIDEYNNVWVQSYGDEIYISFEKTEETDLYRVTIENGKAELEFVATLDNN